jgi:gas vesicle protein
LFPILRGKEKSMGFGRNECSVGTVVLSFFIGTVIGAGVALLLAPEEGEKTRRKITDFAEDMKEKAEDSFEDVRDKVTTALEKGKGLLKKV